MEYEELATGIYVFKNVFNAEIHSQLITKIEAGTAPDVAPWQSASVRSGSSKEVNRTIRDNESTSIPYLYKSLNLNNKREKFFSDMSTIFYEGFNKVEKEYMGIFGVLFNEHDSYNILKYGVGQKFINHVDDHPDYPRRVSIVYYINDNYEGGEIEFPRFNIKYKPKANEALFFPSTYVYNHSVLPVESGYRYSIVSWIH
jgi:hypothetical protein